MAVKRYDIASSLSLQVALYWNAVYAVVFCVFGVFVCTYKLYVYKTRLEWQIVPPCLFLVYAVLEYLRIRLGYSGNLRGKVPELSAFILITFFPQIPIVVLLGILQVPALPVELIMSLPLALLLVCEMVLSYRAVRWLIAKQTAQFFRLCQEGVVADEEANPLVAAQL